MGNLNDSTLIDSVSQLVQIPPVTFKALTNEIQSAGIPWKTVYDDFHSGGWHTAAVYATDETISDGVIRDGVPVVTELLRRLPATQRFLQSLGLDFFAVRLARNDPDSWLWEHRDYIELEPRPRQRLRLHVPLVTNAEALIQFSHRKVHMAAGWIWKLDPVVSHSISNTGPEARVHLILDCYRNATLQALVDRQRLDAEHARPLRLLGGDTRMERLRRGRELLEGGDPGGAERFLLKTFHAFDLGGDTSYDLVIELFRGKDNDERRRHWERQKVIALYERPKMGM